jgi:tetratricopeptide (TPR) repeat protein
MKRYIVLLVIAIGFSSMNVYSQTGDRYLIKAGILVNEKQYEKASEALVQSTSKENKNYLRFFAETEYGLKNYQKAIETYNKLEAENPGTYQLELSRCYASLNNLPKAKEYLSSYFSQKNKLPISKIINDEAFANYKNSPEWQSIWQKADYSDVELKVNQLNTTADSKYTDYQNGIIDEGLKKYPSNPELLYHQSKYFFDNKMYDAAKKSIDKALSGRSLDKYFYLKAQILQKNNNTKEALQAVNDAISRNPYSSVYYLTRIELNRYLGNTEAVNDDLQLIEFSIPDNSEVKLAKIKLEADKGNYLTAIDGLDDLIAADQTHQNYYVLRGQLKLKTQKLQDADEDFGMALDLNPDDADANLGKGMAKMKLDDKAAACYYFQKASNQGSREALEYVNKYCGK